MLVRGSHLLNELWWIFAQAHFTNSLWTLNWNFVKILKSPDARDGIFQNKYHFVLRVNFCWFGYFSWGWTPVLGTGYLTGDGLPLLLGTGYLAGDGLPLVLGTGYLAGDGLPLMLGTGYLTGDGLPLLLGTGYLAGDRLPLMLGTGYLAGDGLPSCLVLVT